MDEWHMGFMDATDAVFDDSGETHQSILHKTGKDKVSAQIATSICQDDCSSPHNGNTTIVIDKLITASNASHEHDDAMVMLRIDFEHLENSDLHSHVDDQLGRMNYCVRTHLHCMSEGSIKELSVSFVDTKFSLTFDASSFSREF